MSYQTEEKRQPVIDIGLSAGEVVGRPEHHDQFAHHSHELNEDAAESMARLLIRAVPLVYGLLLGGLIDDLFLGALLGALLSIGLDLQMREQSMFAPWFKPFLDKACPQIAAASRLLAQGLAAMKLPVPARLQARDCGATQR